MSKFESVEAVLRDVIADRNAELESLRAEKKDLEKKVEELSSETERLKEACEFSKLAISHALDLGYVGEGSTMGMYKDALEKIKAAVEREK